MSARTVLSVAGAFLVIWAILGFMDVSNLTTSGYVTDPDNQVTQVTEGGPAEAAGMEVGDRVVSIDGILIDDTDALSSRGRPAVGREEAIEVERDGETVTLTVMRVAQSSSDRLSSYLTIVVGLVFLGMGLWAYFTAPGASTKLLAVAGVLFAFPFTGGPYRGNGFLSNVLVALVITGFVFAFAKMLHFTMLFPDGKEPDRRLLYGPALLVATVVVAAVLIQPGSAAGFGRVFQFVFIGYVLVYIGLALRNLGKTWAGASAESRRNHGLTLILSGVGIGFGILFLSALLGLVAPNLSLPGGQWLQLSLALVPICCAIAAVRSARSGTGGGS